MNGWNWDTKLIQSIVKEPSGRKKWQKLVKTEGRSDPFCI
jgi:hypothetical protein